MLSITEDDLAGQLRKLNVVALAHQDSRTDEQILQVLRNPPPVSSEKNVWTFWDKGLDRMRSWSQRNVIGWVRQLGPEWNVRVLDVVENSACNIFRFIERSAVPQCLADGSIAGRYAGQHASDMVRLACLYTHGGVWLDVGIMLFMHLDQVCWRALTESTSKVEIALASADPSLVSGLAENFFIAARKRNPFVQRWRDIFFEVWKGKTDCQGIHRHALFEHLVAGGHVARFLQTSVEEKLDYFGAYLAYERLRLLEDPDDGFSGPNYCKNRVLLLEYREFASAAMHTHNDGRRQFDFLATRYESHPQSKIGKDALAFCDHLLSQTAMIKLYHWKDEELPTLAELWDDPNNAGADHRAGTFAEYLRHVSTHYTQTRKLTPLKFPRIREPILYAGILQEDD